MMRKLLTQSEFRLLWVVALFPAITGLPALAQTGPSPSAPGIYRIAGTVINAVTGEPVRRATVTAETGDDYHAVASAETDNEGHFALEGLPAAKYPLTASRSGFRTALYDEHDGLNTAIVTGPDQDTGNLVFRLTPGSVLRGVVTGDGGDPVEGEQVMLFLKPHTHNPGDRIRQAGTTTTDDTGAYEFPNLAPGEYLLAVKADPWYAMHPSGSGSDLRPSNDAAAALDVAYPVTYFDSVTDDAAASTIVLAGGNRETANLNLHAVPALRVEIAAAPSAGGAFLTQSIVGLPVSMQMGSSTNSKPGGTIQMTGVAPGHYELMQGDPPRIVDLDLTSSQQIEANAGTATVAVSGTLVIPSGSALAGNALVALNSADPGQPTAMLPTSSTGGSFSFVSVPPGAWELSVESPTGPLPVASIATGGRNQAGNQITVKDRPLSIVVTVSQGETRVEGFARKADKGAAGVMIVLVPANKSAIPSLMRRDQSDSDGSFSLRNVVPGQYTVVAIEDGWELDWARPEVIGRYLPGGVAVTVTDTSGKLVKLDRPVPVQAH